MQWEGGMSDRRRLASRKPCTREGMADMQLTFTLVVPQPPLHHSDSRWTSIRSIASVMRLDKVDQLFTGILIAK